MILWTPDLGGAPGLTVAKVDYVPTLPDEDQVAENIADWIDKADQFMELHKGNSHHERFMYQGKHAQTGILVIVVKGPNVTNESMNSLANKIRTELLYASVRTLTILVWEGSNTDLNYRCLYACELVSSDKMDQAACEILAFDYSQCSVSVHTESDTDDSGGGGNAGIGPVPTNPACSQFGECFTAQKITTFN